MIPFLATTDAPAKVPTTAQNDRADPSVQIEESGGFGAIFSMGEEDVSANLSALLVDGDAALTTPTADAEDAALPDLTEVDSEAVDAPELVAAEPAVIKAVPADKSLLAPIVARPTKHADPLPPTGGGADTPKDERTINPPPTRASVAQSVVEGQLPRAKTATNDMLAVETEKGVVKAEQPQAKERLIASPDAVVRGNGQAAPLAATPSVPSMSSVAPASQPKDSDPRRIDRTPPNPVLPTVREPIAAPPVVQPSAVAIAQAAPVLRAGEVEKSIASFEPDIGLMTTAGDRPTHVAGTSAPTTTAGPETARHAATQMAVAITNTTNKITEIALNPEELGRVRLSMTMSDGVISLNITAERPETNDLLRRYIDTLAQEFRDLGYDSLSFSFGEGDQTDGKDDFGDADSGAMSTDHIEEDVVIPASPTPLTSGLDLRL